MRIEKTVIERELQERIDAVDCVFLVEYTGMKVTQINELRSLLRKQDARLSVFKNTFLRRAARSRQWPPAFVDGCRGMLAVVTADDPVATARTLHGFGQAHKVPVMRGGIMADRPLSADEVVALATLPSRDQLLGQLAGVLAAPMSGLVRVLGAAQTKLVQVLKAVEDKKSAA